MTTPKDNSSEFVRTKVFKNFEYLSYHKVRADHDYIFTMVHRTPPGHLLFHLRQPYQSCQGRELLHWAEEKVSSHWYLH
jgi:hypothetical protein